MLTVLFHMYSHCMIHYNPYRLATYLANLLTTRVMNIACRIFGSSHLPQHDPSTPADLRSKVHHLAHPSVELFSQSLNTSEKNRLHHLLRFFNKNQILTVPGDGNCFCHAAAIALTSKMKIEPIFAEMVGKTISQAEQDPFPYFANRSKEEDFTTVRSDIRKGDFESLTERTKSGPFLRVIRYLLAKENSKNQYLYIVPLVEGSFIEVNCVELLNSIFATRCMGAILKHPLIPNQAEDVAFVYEGRMEQPTTVPTQLRDQHLEADSVFLFYNSHFSLLV